MVAFTCDKCGRRFTPTIEDLQGYLTQSQGQKHGLVICPHCGRHNKVAVQRLQQALHLRPAAPAAPPAEASAAVTTEQPSAPAAAVTEQPSAVEVLVSATAAEVPPVSDAEEPTEQPTPEADG
jgi:uncharacterized Zn finger protein (UPF0148 family)